MSFDVAAGLSVPELEGESILGGRSLDEGSGVETSDGGLDLCLFGELIDLPRLATLVAGWSSCELSESDSDELLVGEISIFLFTGIAFRFLLVGMTELFFLDLRPESAGCSAFGS